MKDLERANTIGLLIDAAQWIEQADNELEFFGEIHIGHNNNGILLEYDLEGASVSERVIFKDGSALVVESLGSLVNEDLLTKVFTLMLTERYRILGIDKQNSLKLSAKV